MSSGLRASSVVIRIELDGCGCDANSIVKWLNKHLYLISLSRRSLLLDRQHTKNCRECIGGNAISWRTGPYKHDYETDKDEFKRKFGEHFEKRREKQPHDCIMHMIHRVVFGLGKIPCLVFDNADHFDIAFQEQVFRYAHSLYTECLCLVLLPITDTTSWQLSRQGPLQSFYTESFYLPTPSTQVILQKRIDYIDKRIAAEKPEKGRGYFFGRGIPLSIDNLQAFTQTLQSLFLKTGLVAQWIEKLSNQDIRVCLSLVREIVASPYVKVHELLMAWLEKTAMQVSVNDIKLAIIRGKYDIYPVGANKFVHNVFTLVTDIDTSPLLAVRILDYTQYGMVRGRRSAVAVY